MTNFLKSNDTGILIIRIAVGVLLPFHGYSKLISRIDWMAPMLNEFGIPPFVGYGVYIGEIIAPICLLIGFRTRIAGLIVAIDLFMAIFLVLREKVFTLNAGGGWTIELEILFLLSGLALFFTGGGKHSVSAKSRWD